MREGESLHSIAAALWGDASLWYKLADINGLTAASTLSEGQMLVIPADVLKQTHNSKTFNPYDANQALGDTSPTAPKPVGRSNKCGVGQIFLAIIAVAVTIWTAGALSTATTGIWASIGSSSVATGAVAGATGSVVSQAVGVATGVQEKFSWNAVALSAVGGGVGGGIGAQFGEATTALGTAGRAIATNVIMQGIGVATGLQEKFSWASVAAAGVGGAAGFKVGKQLGATSLYDNPSAQNLFANMGKATAATIASAATQSLIEGSDFGDNMLAALPSAIGSVLGEALAGGARYARDADYVRGFGAFADASPEEIRLGVNSMRQLDAVGGVARDNLDGSIENQELLRQLVRQQMATSYGASGVAPFADAADTIVTAHMLDQWINNAETAYTAIGGLDAAQAADAFGVLRDGLGQARGLERQTAAFLSPEVDNLLIATGSTAEQVNTYIGERPWLRYSLEAVSFVAGPAQWAVGQVVGEVTEPLIAQATDAAAHQFTEAGYGVEQSRHGGGGVLTVGALGIGGVAGGFSKVRQLLQSGFRQLRGLRIEFDRNAFGANGGNIRLVTGNALVRRIQQMLPRYPSIIDLKTGRPIPFPRQIVDRVPIDARVPWGMQERGDFIGEWYRRGHETPPGGWAEYDIHHIQPREFGGTNAFDNLTPVVRTVHQTTFNDFWREVAGR